MKQFQFEYKDMPSLERELRKISQWANTALASSVVFHIFEDVEDEYLLEKICHTIRRMLPDAVYVGCSSNGNVMNGDIATGDIIIRCIFFEYQTTQVKLLHYDLEEQTAEEVKADIVKQIESRPWVSMVEMLVTLNSMSMTELCDAIDQADPRVQVFGGAAFSVDMVHEKAAVFSSLGKYTHQGFVLVLAGGEDFHVHTFHLTGWKPLGKVFHVTKYHDDVMEELDGRPAFETYNKYLNIQNDENFFENSLEFPLFFEENGIELLRAPVHATEDGSVIMTSAVGNNGTARLAYGDPWTILNSVHEGVHRIEKFQPECISVFSCAARRAFWGDSDVGKELRPFQTLAPTFGFFTAGEFLRTNGHINLHNVTLVVAAMREGEVDDSRAFDINTKYEAFTGRVSMINRLATFIEVVTEEYYEANRQLEVAAITDGLTKLYNRREIQHRISERVVQLQEEEYKYSTSRASLIMIDIDDFKKVNDTYGHKEGDTVLTELAKLLKQTIAEFVPDGSVGRWGGEEFMILLPTSNLDHAKKVAEEIRVRFAEIKFPTAPKQTLSLGVTEELAGENVDALTMRVDDALYEAKHNGKNQVVFK